MMLAWCSENRLAVEKLPAGNFLQVDLKTPIELAFDVDNRGATNG